MNDFGINPESKNAFVDGILQIIEYSNREFELKDLGLWRTEDWKKQLFLSPFNSVDWYLEQTVDKTRNQIDAQKLLALFYCEPWQDQTKHIDLFITNKDLYVPGTNYVLGLAIPGIGAVISSKRFSNLYTSLSNECIKTVTMHEFGHVLGLVPEYRLLSVEDSLGKHCTNRCLMRQGLTVNDWVLMTQERLNGVVLCELCRNDLMALSYYNS
jgi:predicted Zn-dependent protease